ncbi:MAG: chemotaxis protein CheX [Planctomycetota bacterium]|jgi:chemotaxis protein CheX
MVDEVCVTDALLAGAKEVFETMIFMDIDETCEPEQEIEGSTLLGSITFKGNIEGCLAICCGMPCAKAIAANMLGMDSAEEVGEEEVCDAIGEVANMVMGSVKARLQESAGNVEVSIPTVVSGHGLQNSLGDKACKVLVKASFDNEYIAELSVLYREASD